jgi:hypothetical protein
LQWRWLAVDPTHDKYNNANHKHQEWNLIDAMHEAQIQICLFFFEKITRVEIV